MRLLKIFAMGLGSLLLLGLVGLVTASRLEEHDTFCTACHREPEVTYFDRAHAAPASTDVADVTDLASYHYWQNPDFQCIDCHRGDDSVEQRLRVLALAAGDTATFALGNPDNTVERAAQGGGQADDGDWRGPERYSRTPDVLNAGCLKCHEETVTLVGFENHFHNKMPAFTPTYAATGQLNYPPDWSGPRDGTELPHPVDTVVTCLDCHQAHVAGFATQFFLNVNSVVFPACVQCHAEAGQGPLDLLRQRNYRSLEIERKLVQSGLAVTRQP